MKKKTIIWICIIVAAIIAIFCWMFIGACRSYEVKYDTAKVQQADIANSVTATGTIEPVTSITVGTQVSGIVNKLYVDYNTVVKKGQVIAELDKTNLISQLNSAKATLSNASSTLSYQTANYKRYSTLYKKALISAEDFETPQRSDRQAKDQESSAREEVQR